MKSILLIMLVSAILMVIIGIAYGLIGYSKYWKCYRRYGIPKNDWITRAPYRKDIKEAIHRTGIQDAKQLLNEALRIYEFADKFMIIGVIVFAVFLVVWYLNKGF